MGRNQVYCCICGGPFFGPGQRQWRGTREWLAHAAILTTEHDTDNGVQLDNYWSQIPWGSAVDLGPKPAENSKRRVLELNADYDELHGFTILQSSKKVDAFSMNADFFDRSVNGGKPLSFAVHSLWIKLAKLFIAFRVETSDTFRMNEQDEISSIKQLWGVLYRRMPGTHLFAPEYILQELHDYFGGIGCRNVYRAPDENLVYGEVCTVQAVPFVFVWWTDY
ncbi:hypothetical protein B0O99DRAFT_591687 [Bisporella sp. PMI_857]|nr:hypothetical protein B0O99DRAFT_591687 [Bisporella sp. PMI_857]